MSDRNFWLATIDYIKEMRRHHLAMAKAAERLIVELDPKTCYTKDVVDLEADSVTSVQVEYQQD